MHRWFFFDVLLMREKSLKINLVIFILHGVHPLLFWMILLSAFTHPLMVTGCVILRCVVIRKVQVEVTQDIRPHPVMSIISEMMQPVHLLHALCNRSIIWRTKSYKVFSNKKFISK